MDRKREILMSKLLYQKLLSDSDIQQIITHLSYRLDEYSDECQSLDTSVDTSQAMDSQPDNDLNEKESPMDQMSCKTGEDSKYWCECGQGFNLRVELSVHYKCVHLNVKPFRCQYDGCDQSYKRAHHLALHVNTKHLNQRFNCTDCEMTYATVARLNTHLKKCHQK